MRLPRQAATAAESDEGEFYSRLAQTQSTGTETTGALDRTNDEASFIGAIW